MTWSEVIELWQSENQTFKYGDNDQSFEVIGHYTQVRTFRLKLL